MKIKKKNVLKLYNLPKEVFFCKKCTISNQRPRISFNANGICSACQFAEFKRKKINWKKREEELLRLLDKHRSKTNVASQIQHALMVTFRIMILSTSEVAVERSWSFDIVASM